MNNLSQNKYVMFHVRMCLKTVNVNTTYVSVSQFVN